MLRQKFVAIGHITNDISPGEHLGGGVSYSAVTAARMGLEAHIITKCPINHPFVKELKELGVIVHILPSNLNTITTFDTRNARGKRSQTVSEIQELISPKDEKSFPWHILKDSIILVAPVTTFDVDRKLFPYLAKYGDLNVIPQGYFRKILKNGNVVPKKWENFRMYASSMKTVVLSEEDIVLQPNLVKYFPLVVLTQGAKGAVVYRNGQKICQTNAFPLQRTELVDFEGAGDVFAAAFIIEMIRKSGDIKASSEAACLLAAVKISGICGIGVNSIPSRKQIAEFLKKHSKLAAHVVKL